MCFDCETFQTYVGLDCRYKTCWWVCGSNEFDKQIMGGCYKNPKFYFVHQVYIMSFSRLIIQLANS